MRFSQLPASLTLILRQGIKWLAGRTGLAKARGAWWWRHACAALAALNITGADYGLRTVQCQGAKRAERQVRRLDVLMSGAYNAPLQHRHAAV